MCWNDIYMHVTLHLCTDEESDIFVLMLTLMPVYHKYQSQHQSRVQKYLYLEKRLASPLHLAFSHLHRCWSLQVRMYQSQPQYKDVGVLTSK